MSGGWCEEARVHIHAINSIPNGTQSLGIGWYADTSSAQERRHDLQDGYIKEEGREL
jgi:hypothetical protein